jgi:hypothetical protein
LMRAKAWSVSKEKRVVPTTTLTINTTYLTRAPNRWERVRGERVGG